MHPPQLCQRSRSHYLSLPALCPSLVSQAVGFSSVLLLHVAPCSYNTKYQRAVAPVTHGWLVANRGKIIKRMRDRLLKILGMGDPAFPKQAKFFLRWYRMPSPSKVDSYERLEIVRIILCFTLNTPYLLKTFITPILYLIQLCLVGFGLRYTLGNYSMTAISAIVQSSPKAMYAHQKRLRRSKHSSR